MQFTTLSISALLFAVSLAAPSVHRRQEQNCSDAELDLSWNQYDQNRDGYVDGADLSRISVATGDNLTLLQGNARVAEWDTNGDGLLDREELTSATDICF